jgi:hypothetical protein
MQVFPFLRAGLIMRPVDKGGGWHMAISNAALGRWIAVAA